MFIFFTIAIVVLLLLAFMATIYLGKSQKRSQNQQYDNRRIHTIWLLSLIYLLAVISGLVLIYFFIIR